MLSMKPACLLTRLQISSKNLTSTSRQWDYIKLAKMSIELIKAIYLYYLHFNDFNIPYHNIRSILGTGKLSLKPTFIKTWTNLVFLKFLFAIKMKLNGKDLLKQKRVYLKRSYMLVSDRLKVVTKWQRWREAGKNP